MDSVDTDDSKQEIDTESSYSTQYFMFSATAFVDTVYNSIMEKWIETVNEVITPYFHDHEANVRNRLLSTILKHNCCDSLLQRLEKYVKTYVFHIPECITLPQDQCHLDKASNSNSNVLARIQYLNEEILKIRVAMEVMDMDRQQYERSLVMLENSDLKFRKISLLK